MYRVEVDRKLCSSTSNCVEDAPLAFEMGEDGIARALPGATPDDLLRGAQACPVEAIRVYDTATGKRVFP
jgi:ferredoxin